MSAQDFISSLLPLHYEGREIRAAVDEQGMIWWIAQDIVQPLGYRTAAEALRMLDDDEKGIRHVSTLGGPQRMSTVNESGLFHLIFGSRKAEAKTFRRWVTGSVLPTLHRTGSYTMPSLRAEMPETPTHDRLPPPKPRIREHAEVSTHLIAIWRVLREAQEPVTNREIAQRATVALRTATAHSRYLFQLGLLQMYETFPRHLYMVNPAAAEEQSHYWQRLEMIRGIFESRRGLSYEELQLFNIREE